MFEKILIWIIGIITLIQVLIIDAFSNQVIILLIMFCYLEISIHLNKIEKEVKHGRNKRINIK